MCGNSMTPLLSPLPPNSNVACHTIKFAHVNAPTCHPPHSSLKVPKLYIQPQSTKAAAEERWLSVNLAFFCCQPLTENPNMSPSLPESQQLDAVSSSPPYSTPTANLFFCLEYCSPKKNGYNISREAEMLESESAKVSELYSLF